MTIQKQRIRFFRVDDGVFPILVHRRFRRANHACTHLHRLCAKREGRCHRPSTDYAASSDDWHIDFASDERQQNHQRHILGIFEAAALTAFNNKAIYARVDGFQCASKRWDNVEYGKPRGL